MFSKSQLKTISEICNGVGQVYFASIVIPFLLSGFKMQTVPIFIFGLGSALVFWIISISLSNSTRRQTI